jgi:hypothetical protein
MASAQATTALLSAQQRYAADPWLVIGAVKILTDK